MTSSIEHPTGHEPGHGQATPRRRGLLMRPGLVRGLWCAALFFLIGLYIVAGIRWLAGWDPVYDWEVIILVSGINSFPQDPTFDPLIAKLFGDPRYDVYRFGADPAYPYDALGDLDVNARNLRDEVRALGITHPGVHIVAHSMGGAVADRAFAAGLSANDGVATYVALASPHNGSSTLAAAALVLDASGDRALEISKAAPVNVVVIVMIFLVTAFWLATFNKGIAFLNQPSVVAELERGVQ